MKSPQPQTDRQNEHDRFLEAVRQGLADSEAGRLIDDEDLFAELLAEPCGVLRLSWPDKMEQILEGHL